MDTRQRAGQIAANLGGAQRSGWGMDGWWEERLQADLASVFGERAGAKLARIREFGAERRAVMPSCHLCGEPTEQERYGDPCCAGCKEAATEARRARVQQATWRAFGEDKPLKAWADDLRCRVPYRVLAARVYRGWDIRRALTEPRGLGGRNGAR